MNNPAPPAELDQADRLSLRAAAREFLGDTLPPNRRPSEVDTSPPDRTMWRRMAGEVGLPGVQFGEADGGSGLGLDAELLVHEELGRVLASVPYLSTVATVGSALRTLDGPDPAELRRELVAGDLVAAALLDPVPATDHNGQFVLSGGQDGVLDALGADALLVAAEGPGGPALAWVPLPSAQVVIEPLPAVDLTRRFARVRLDAAPARILATGPAATAALAAARTGQHLGLAAESIGVAARALEMAVEYVKVRHQFGRPIGSFQAVKHLCAEMLVRLEGARSALVLAARAAGQPDERRAAAALAVARTHCGERCFWVTNEAIHLHGGIGFTWEHPAHLYFRRAKSNQHLLDPQSDQRQVLAELVATQYREEATAR